MTSERGQFVVIEGIDGAGSSTQAARLAERLRLEGHKVLATKEPTAGPAGALIRLALDRRLRGPNRNYLEQDASASRDDAFDHRALALLFAADRLDHLHAVIEPALQQGRWVVCDRYVLSSLAYQGMEVDIEWVGAINQFARAPDLTVYLDVPVERTQARMRATRLTAERYEREDEQLQVRESYQRAIEEYRKRFGRVEVVDASAAADTVAGDVWSATTLLAP